jgi:hypothetical protein
MTDDPREQNTQLSLNPDFFFVRKKITGSLNAVNLCQVKDWITGTVNPVTLRQAKFLPE